MDDLTLVLDLWNAYIKCVVFAKEDNKTIIVAKDKVKSKWMRKGKILDVNDFIYSIRTLLDSFDKKIWVDFFDQLYIWVSHPDMKVKRLAEQKRIIDDEITHKEMNHLSSLIDETSWEANYETIKIIPVQWVIDKEIKLKDPSGMEWKRLELLADVFMLPRSFYNSLSEVFESLEIGVVDIVPNILWSTEVCLDVDSKDLGTLLVDIGANQTSYVVYEEWYPLDYGTVPIGGEEVTKDISIWLQLDINEAETIKRQKWTVAVSKDIQDDESVDMAFLSDVILARYEEIFEKIDEDLQEINKSAKLPGGVLLIGGWAKLEWLDYLAKQVFQLASFYWKDKSLNLWQVSNDLQYLNVIGVYAWLEKYEDDIDSWFDFSINFGGFFKKIINFLKELI